MSSPLSSLSKHRKIPVNSNPSMPSNDQQVSCSCSLLVVIDRCLVRCYRHRHRTDRLSIDIQVRDKLTSMTDKCSMSSRIDDDAQLLNEVTTRMAMDKRRTTRHAHESSTQGCDTLQDESKENCFTRIRFSADRSRSIANDNESDASSRSRRSTSNSTSQRESEEKTNERCTYSVRVDYF
jgi:hypothetical protein